MTDLPYRRGVGLMLFNGRGHVFVGQRNDMAGEAWQMPQGGIDDGEAPETAALRELEEEIGTNKAAIIAQSADWIRYDFPAGLAGWVRDGKYRGQMQKWFALRFTGIDADIDLNTAHPEFRAWRWAAYGDLVDLVVPFKRELYQAVVAEFAELAAELTQI